ncbi:hypothetical protein LguiA_015165 [Lonicera macranthoides]
MGSRIPSHQLSSGLYVSGRPEHLKSDRQSTTAASCAVPYTGGDVKKSGDLAKMFDISMSDRTSSAAAGPPMGKPSRQSSSSQTSSGSVRSGTVKFSGPIVQPTGLITSGPLGRRSGQLDAGAPVGKAVYGSAVTSLSEGVKLRFKMSKLVMWVLLVVFVMGFVVGVFYYVALKKVDIFVAVVVVVVMAVVVVLWNLGWKERGLLGFLNSYPDAELRGATDGQYVKVTGVVTCGSIPLESSFQRIPRCVYISAELYEYRGWGGKSANPRHRSFSWGCRHSEKYVTDFYISDFQSGLRAVVKAGNGAKVAPFVKPTTVVDITKNRDLSPSFLRWLADRSLSSDDRVMRLKEGHIKEGSTVSVMGVVRRHDNILMIVPPTEPISTGCQWARCLLPTYVEGLVLTCDESQNADVIPV